MTMKRLLYLALIGVLMVTFTGCKENYSVGEKVGNLIEFTKKGVIWDSWEGRMNLTQTGMNTSGEPFQFSFDNDRDDQDSLVQLLYQAQVEGWKVKLKYHAVWGFVEVLDKDFANPLRQMSGGLGRVVDTVWVVVDKAEMLKHGK